MGKILDFLKIITTDQYLGWVLLGIFVLVILVFIFIVANYQAKKQKVKDDARKYRLTELSSLSDEEVKNIANNVSDPEVLYQKLEEHEILVNAEINKGKTKTTANKKSTTQKEAEPTKKPTQTTKKSTKKVEEQVKTPAEEETKKSKKVVYTGKWKIKQDDGKFFAELSASNGVIVLKTEYYTSLTGVKNGIETIKKNVTDGNFATSVDKNGRYCFKLFSKSNRLICVSDYYSSKAKCEGGINSVKRFALAAIIIIEEN